VIRTLAVLQRGRMTVRHLKGLWAMPRRVTGIQCRCGHHRTVHNLKSQCRLCECTSYKSVKVHSDSLPKPKIVLPAKIVSLDDSELHKLTALAVCSGLTSLFYSGRTRQAKQVCAGCSVTELCLRYTQSQPDWVTAHGVWAGLSPGELRDARFQG
jgi:hypothetical protein